MTDKAAIVFKSEDSMWQTLEGLTGSRAPRQWDPRRYTLQDERIRRLAAGALCGPGAAHVQSAPHWVPDEKQISFLNVDTHELLTVEYHGMEFAPWAPGWCFLLLGKVLTTETLA